MIKLHYPDVYFLRAKRIGQNRFEIVYEETFEQSGLVENTAKALRAIEAFGPGATISVLDRGKKIRVKLQGSRRVLADMLVGEFFPKSRMAEVTIGDLYESTLRGLYVQGVLEHERKNGKR